MWGGKILSFFYPSPKIFWCLSPKIFWCLRHLPQAAVSPQASVSLVMCKKKMIILSLFLRRRRALGSAALTGDRLRAETEAVPAAEVERESLD